MKKTVALIEIPVLNRLVPLASAYMEGVASLNPVLRDQFDIRKHSVWLYQNEVENAVSSIDADVYGFSCYVWNSKLIRRIISRLLQRRPNAHILLGGPQVMHKGHQYLDASKERVVVCNGEGEYTFSTFLESLVADFERPHLTGVPGISFHRDGRFITTVPQPRNRDLDSMPSPYLEGFIDPTQYSLAALETNRGCPFRCTYCYWGAATNAKVHKFETGRLFDEITWISQNKFMYLIINDANFGMLPRDLDLAVHIAECKSRYGAPLKLFFSSSKNTPERVIEITKIFNKADLLTGQPVALQTVTQQALEAVERDNIKERTYIELQKQLNAGLVPSFVELIWPLPGETLETFKAGIDRLCRLKANALTIYNLVLINNVAMDDKREELGIETLDDPDPFSEARIVVKTKQVSNVEYHAGMRFCYHVECVYSCRALWNLLHYLDEKGLCGYSDVVSAFGKHCASVIDDPYGEYIERTFSSMEVYKLSGLGGSIHTALHSGTVQFDYLLLNFAKTLPGNDMEEFQLMLELDLLNRPLAYFNTPVVDRGSLLRVFKWISMDKTSVTVQIPQEHAKLVCNLLRISQSAGNTFKIQYRTTQHEYFVKHRPLEAYYMYCFNKMRGEIGSIMPVWSPVCAQVVERSAA